MAFGTAVAMQGPVLPGIREDLGLSDFVSGVFVAAQGAGWGLGGLLGGLVANRRGRRLGFIIGTCLMAAGLFTEAAAPHAAVVLFGVFVTMLGGGFITGSLNASLSDVGPRAVSFANAFFGLGAIAGPLIAAGMIRYGPGWRAALVIGAAGMLTTLLLSSSIPDGEPSHPADRHGVRGLSRSPIFLLLTFILGLEIASEAGLVGWFPTYAVSARGFEPWAAAAAIVAFWLGTAVSRLALAGWTGTIRPRGLLPAITALGAVAAAGATLLPGAVAAVAMLGLAGLAAGGVFPLVITGVAEAFPHDTNVATGVLLATAGTLETLVPLVIGVASTAAGTTAAGMFVIVATWSASAVTAAAFGRRATVPAAAG